MTPQALVPFSDIPIQYSGNQAAPSIAARSRCRTWRRDSPRYEATSTGVVALLSYVALM